MSGRRAAGTGAFLEKTARYLGLTTEDIGPYALRSTSPKSISSVCAVFAESEVINHLSNGIPAEDIMMGAMVSLGGRAIQLMRRVGLEPTLLSLRGGTDGAGFTAAGLPCPNLSTGEHNPHSPLEWTCLEEMETAVRVLVELARLWGEQ